MARVNKQKDLPRRSGKTGRKRSRGRGEGWVRKNVVMDQRKLDTARRLLGVETETEAIDVALDLVAFRRELRPIDEHREAFSSPKRIMRQRSLRNISSGAIVAATRHSRAISSNPPPRRWNYAVSMVFVVTAATYFQASRISVRLAMMR